MKEAMAIRGLCAPNREAPLYAKTRENPAHQRKPSAKRYVNKQLENSKKSKLHDGDRSRYLVWGRNGGWEQARRNFWIINNLVFFSGCVSTALPTLWNLLSCRFLLFVLHAFVLQWRGYFKKNNYEINIARGTKAICLPQTCSLFHFKRQMWFTFNIWNYDRFVFFLKQFSLF